MQMNKIHPAMHFMMCVAAKTIVCQREAKNPILQTDEVREPQELEIELPEGVQNQIVIECPSLPIIFLYLDQSPTDIVIILVEN